MSQAGGKNGRRIVTVVLNVSIALLHFVTGSGYRGPYPAFVNGYMIDILLPLGLYFLLGLSDLPALKSWAVKSGLVFGVGAGVEIAQFFGVPLLGRTFDPLDFLMYGIGVLAAVVLDTAVFPRIFRFWAPGAEGAA